MAEKNRFALSVVNLIEKTLFDFNYLNSNFEVYYKPTKIESAISIYYYIRFKFDENIIKQFFYLSERGIKRLKELFQNYDADKYFEPVNVDVVEMNIINYISDYHRNFSECIKEISDKNLENLNSSYNFELSKHINYLINIKNGKISNLEFDNLNGLKRFVQVVYFLSQNISDEVLSDMVFFSNLVNSDLKMLFTIEKEKIIHYSNLTLFCQNGEDSYRETDVGEYLTVNFSLLSQYYSIEDILKLDEVKKIVEIYKNYLGSENININFNTLDYIISIFADKKDYEKLREVYYELWKKVLEKEINKIATNI